MDDRDHDICIDQTSNCSLFKFVDEMASKIIWVRGHQLVVWGVDKESGSELKVATNEKFQKIVEARWDAKQMDVTS